MARVSSNSKIVAFQVANVGSIPATRIIKHGFSSGMKRGCYPRIPHRIMGSIPIPCVKLSRVARVVDWTGLETQRGSFSYNGSNPLPDAFSSSKFKIFK